MSGFNEAREIPKQVIKEQHYFSYQLLPRFGDENLKNFWSLLTVVVKCCEFPFALVESSGVAKTCIRKKR